MKIYKVCEYCHAINKIQSEMCTKCGRFKNNLILGEYSPKINDTLTNEDLKIARENFIAKSKYPYYKDNIVPTRETYPVTTKPKKNLILNVGETTQPPVPYISKYDTQAQKQKALEDFYIMQIRQQRQQELQKKDDIDILEEIFKWIVKMLKNNLLFRYIFAIILVTVFLIWFLGGLFSQFY